MKGTLFRSLSRLVSLLTQVFPFADENRGQHNSSQSQADPEFINDEGSDLVLNGQWGENGLNKQVVAGMHDGSRPPAFGFQAQPAKHGVNAQHHDGKHYH